MRNKVYTFRAESLVHANQSQVFKSEGASSEQEAEYDIKKNVRRWAERKGLRESEVVVTLIGVRKA